MTDSPQIPDASTLAAARADAGRIFEALRSAADQEFTIAERLATKARQGFALAAAFFAISQTVAFSSFEAEQLSHCEKRWLIGLAIAAITTLAAAAGCTIWADSLFGTRDLPLATLEHEVNAAYDGDLDVLGRLVGLYLGIVRSRRNANNGRRTAYKASRVFVVLALAATCLELIYGLAARA